jgi:hypothetical protein
MFYYYGDNGVKYFTPSAALAMSRAKSYGTNDVYIVK